MNMSTDQDDSDSSFTMEPPPDREEIERQIKDLQELLGEIDEEEDVKPDDKWTAIGIFPLMIAGLAAIFAIFWVGYPLIDDNYLASPVPEALENQIFHWRHNVGWDFRVQIGDNNGEGPPLLHWEGLQPPFAGWKKTVEPRITKIRKDIYFMTWTTPMGLFDSVVLDLEKEKVYTHSKVNAKFIAVEGEIYCNGLRQACEPPKKG